MTLGADEFIRRFLLHVLPDGFHRIRHYGLFATSQCKANVARVRSLLAPAQKPIGAEPEPASDAGAATPACPCCGGRLVIIERFRRGETPRAPDRDPDRNVMTADPITLVISGRNRSPLSAS